MVKFGRLLPRYFIGRLLIQSQLASALSFNGTTTTAQRSVLGDSSTWSAFGWIYPTATPGSTVTLIKNGESGTGNGGWKLGLTTASHLNLSDPGGVWGGTGSATIANNAWTHVGFIQNGSSTQLYVNGATDGSAISGTHNASQVDFTIGCTRSSSTGGFSAFFKGYIQDVRVWTRVISSDELAALYALTELAGITTPNINTTSLAGWYELNGNGNDSSGNSRTLTVTNATYVPGVLYNANIPPRTVRSTLSYATGRIVAPK